MKSTHPLRTTLLFAPLAALHAGRNLLLSCRLALWATAMSAAVPMPALQQPLAFGRDSIEVTASGTLRRRYRHAGHDRGSKVVPRALLTLPKDPEQLRSLLLKLWPKDAPQLAHGGEQT